MAAQDANGPHSADDGYSDTEAAAVRAQLGASRAEDDSSMAVFLRFVRDNPGLAGSILLFLTIATKVWSVAHGDTRTIAIILTQSDALATALSVILVSLPALSLVVGLVTVAALNRLPAARARFLLTIAVFLLIVLATFPNAVIDLIPSWLTWVVGAVILIVGALLSLKIDGEPVLRTQSVLLIVAAATWAVIALSPVPWIPAERLDMKLGSSWSGYVIEENDNSISLLSQESRTVWKFELTDIAQRNYCTVSPWTSKPILALWLWPSEGLRYRPCE
jgi:hypothetical protein